MIATESPLRIPVFRSAWLSSVLTNLGLLIQGVGVAWVMVEIAPREAMVAWVQAATALPLMLLSIPAGAIADVFDRRRVALVGLFVALAGAFALLSVSYAGRLTPELLLVLCFLTGSGMALYDPAWQASVPGLVPLNRLPQAIALRSISQNLARAFGPAVGGVLVAWKGGVAAFFCTVVFFIPLIVVLLRWRNPVTPPKLPPERVDRAVLTGLRYVRNSPSIRTVVTKAFISGMVGVGVLALMPLAAKYRLQGGAIQYGVMLGAFGVGAVLGAINMPRLRERFSAERLVSLSMAAIGLGAVSMAVFQDLRIVSVFLVVSGTGWLIVFSTLNTSVQTISPRWVMGRTVATYAAATTGGMVVGSLIWGEMVQVLGLVYALSAVAAGNFGAALLGIWLRLPDRISPSAELESRPVDVPLALDIIHRSGPITVEKEYRIDPSHARDFCRVMQKVARLRKRNGAYGWSLSRDITDAWLWIERFHFSIWLEYLRLNDRATARDMETLQEAEGFQAPGTEIRTRYQLERPMGSVRSHDAVPDAGAGTDTQIQNQ